MARRLKGAIWRKMEKKRYKILIADDEYWTREKLRHMIDWEEYGLDCLEPAQNGEEVLERIEAEKPDILITDINMPYVNGVELLETIKKDYPGIVAFVVSGYDDFEYVKGTFMSGAVNYLVKPVAKIDMVNAIVKALEIIGERENEKQEHLKAVSLIQDREYSQLIEREESAYAPGIAMDSGIYLMLVKIHNYNELVRQSRYDMNLFSFNVKREIRRLSGQENILVFNHVFRSNEFIILSDMGNQGMVKLAEKIKIHFAKKSDVCLTFVINSHSCSIESVRMAYVEAVALFMTRTFCKRNEVLLTGNRESEKQEKYMNKRFTAVHENRMKNFLQSGQFKNVRKVIFDEVGLCKCEGQKWGYLEVRQTVRQVTNVLEDYMLQAEGRKNHRDILEIDSLTEAADKSVESLDEKAVCSAVEDMIEYLEPEYAEVPTDTMKGVVRQAVAYIDENFFEELTLDFFAKKYNVEGSYFSRMFRQEIGENFVLYLTRRRLEKAKEYIRTDEANLTEIAFMVGYADYSYFNRVFKKNVGISPREYRNQNLSK